MQTFSSVLSPEERHNLLKIYLVPGIFSSLLSLDFAYLSLIHARHALWYFQLDSPVELILLSLSVLLITLILCPLETIVTRLALQKYRSKYFRSPPVTVLPLQFWDDVIEDQVLRGQTGRLFLGDEDVITLRDETDPYEGMVDCARKIVKEEGWDVFWRGWLIAFFINIVADSTLDISSHFRTFLTSVFQHRL